MEFEFDGDNLKITGTLVIPEMEEDVLWIDDSNLYWNSFNTHDAVDAIYNSDSEVTIEYVGCSNVTQTKESFMNSGLELIGVVAVSVIALGIILFIIHLCETIFAIKQRVDLNGERIVTNNQAINALHRKIPNKKSRGRKGRK